jgi:hypothetical protein
MGIGANACKRSMDPLLLAKHGCMRITKKKKKQTLVQMLLAACIKVLNTPRAPCFATPLVAHRGVRLNDRK